MFMVENLGIRSIIRYNYMMYGGYIFWVSTQKPRVYTENPGVCKKIS